MRNGLLSRLRTALQRRRGQSLRENVGWLCREIAKRVDPVGGSLLDSLTSTDEPPDEYPSIVHVVNPVAAADGSSLQTAQQVTFRSIDQALEQARDQGVSVEVWAVGYPEDRAVVPTHVTWQSTLERSGMDLSDFRVARKLPLLADILEVVSSAPPDTVVVYSNIDISLMPGFYTAVSAISLEREGFIVNRRTIPTGSAQTPLALFEAQVGQPHPGFDCFVFRAGLVEQLDIGEIVVGVPYVGQTLALNLAAFADDFGVFRSAHLTYHLGNDRNWTSSDQADWVAHNHSELERVHRRLSRDFEVPSVERCMNLSTQLRARGRAPQ